MVNDALGDRMKLYEQDWAGKRFIPLLPICARLDGKNFSRFTRNFKRPFDEGFHEAMAYVAKMLVEDTGAVISYTQSDEISLIYYSDSINSQVFYDGKVQKMVSVLSSMATFHFQRALERFLPDSYGAPAFFDCRVWLVPNKEEAVNTLVWRELDATKNSISMAASHYYSHKELMNKSGSEKQEMLFQKGVNWNNYPDTFKRGSYFQRKKKLLKFSAEELDRLPEKHAARANPDLMIERTVVERVKMPPIIKIPNRVEVVFNDAELERDVI